MIADDRQRAVEAKHVTLDGKPAVIIGRLNPYATVASLDGKLRGEWSWDAAIRIALTHGGFVL